MWWPKEGAEENEENEENEGMPAARGGAGAPRRATPLLPLASMARVKANTSGFEGDKKLAKMTSAPSATVYCQNSHGLTWTADTETINPYTSTAYTANVKEVPMPPQCALVMSVQVGEIDDADLFQQRVFYAAWKESGNCPTFSNIVSTDKKKRKKAHDYVVELLTSKESNESKPVPPPIIHTERYIEHIILPYASWKAVREGTREYLYMRSGIYPCGVECSAVSIEKTSKMPDSLLNFIFDGSLYPTYKELLADNYFRNIRLCPTEQECIDDTSGVVRTSWSERTTMSPYDDDDQRYNSIRSYLSRRYACTQTALFTVFPGVHYALTCRVVPSKAHRTALPTMSGRRKYSATALEAASSAITAGGIETNAMTKAEKREANTRVAAESAAFEALMVAMGGKKRQSRTARPRSRPKYRTRRRR